MTEKPQESPANDASSTPLSKPDVPKPVVAGEAPTLGSTLLEAGMPIRASSQSADNQPEAPTKATDAWWLKHLKEHPFKALSLAVSVYGGLILLAFFVRLGSMPELDLAGATATLAAVAVVGLLVVSALGGTTIAAGLATRSLALDAPHLTSWRSLMSLALPGGFFIFAVAIAVVCKAVHFEVWWLWILLVLSFFMPMAECWYQLEQQKKDAVPATQNSDGAEDAVRTAIQEKKTKALGDYIVYAASGFVWCVSALITLLTYDAFARQGGANDAEAGFALALWGAASILLNVLVVKSPPKIQGLAFLALGGASVVILTMLTASWSAIPVAAVRTLGLGEIPVGAVVTAEGCDIFNKAARGQKVCQMDADQKQGWVCPVILKSRIGAPLVFELNSIGDNGSWPIQPFEIETKRKGGKVSHQRYQRIQVAKSEVKSWPSITPLPRPTESESASGVSTQNNGATEADTKEDSGKNAAVVPRRLVTYLDPSAVAENSDQKQWLETQCGPAPKAEPATTKKLAATETKKKPNSGKRA